MGYIVPSLVLDVLDGAVTKLGKTISLTIDMVVVERVGLAWNLCGSSGWPVRKEVQHRERAF